MRRRGGSGGGRGNHRLQVRRCFAASWRRRPGARPQGPGPRFFRVTRASQSTAHASPSTARTAGNKCPASAAPRSVPAFAGPTRCARVHAGMSRARVARGCGSSARCPFGSAPRATIRAADRSRAEHGHAPRSGRGRALVPGRACRGRGSVCRRLRSTRDPKSPGPRRPGPGARRRACSERRRNDALYAWGLAPGSWRRGPGLRRRDATTPRRHDAATPRRACKRWSTRMGPRGGALCARLAPTDKRLAPSGKCPRRVNGS